MFSAKDIFEISSDAYLSEYKLNDSSYDRESLWRETLKIACLMGKVRLISKIKDYGLKFRNHDTIFDKDKPLSYKNGKLEFDLKYYISRCIHEGGAECTADLQTVLNDVMVDNNNYDTWQICVGHDLSFLVSKIYSIEMIGNNRLTEKNVEDDLRHSYVGGRGRFKATQMYRDIKKWQEDNRDYQVLDSDLL